MNTGVLRVSTRNVTKQFKLCILIRAKEFAEAEMRQFAAQKRQAKKEKMRKSKGKVI